MNTKLTKISRSNLEKEDLLTVETEKVEMSLNTESSLASGLLIQRLTELYENPIVASVRETVSNALDSLVKTSKGRGEVGGKVWIEKPTKLNPVFTVRDNGVGMSYEDLKNVYAKYGASTKVNNFNQIGAYGLGAKAPLAYGTEFTVTSVKDGEKTTVMVIREELTNYIKIINRSKTDEESGTTVSIPVSSSDVETFSEEAEKYAKYPLGNKDVSVYVDGEKNMEEGYICVTEDLVIHKSDNEVILGKVWIKRDTKFIVNILTQIQPGYLNKYLKYLVGGWIYNNPKYRGGYSRTSGEVIVEVKPGILGFNSSRDVILPNDRYSTFEDLVVEGISSKEFFDSLMESIKNLEEKEFKNLMVNLALKSINNIKNEYKDLSKNDGKELRYNKYNIDFALNEEFSFNTINLKNKDGYSLAEMLKDVPEEEENKTFTLLIHKDKYSKINKNSAFWLAREQGISTSFNSYTISEVKERYKNRMIEGKQKDQPWEILIFKLISELKDNHQSNSNFSTVFVTDISGTEKEINSVFNKRNKILDLTSNNISSNLRFSSYIVFTTHTKEEIEKMLDSVGIKDELKVVSVEEAENLIKKDRKKNNKVNKEKKKEEMSYYMYDENSDSATHPIDLTGEDIKKIAKGKKKIHFLTISKSDSAIHFDVYSLMRNWIYNKEGNQDNILIIATGLHRKVDLESIADLGEFYYRQKLVGNTDFYKNLVGNKKIGSDLLLNTNPNIREIAFSSFLYHILKDVYVYNSNSISILESKLNKFKKLCEITGLEYEEVNLDEIKKADAKNSFKRMSQAHLQSLAKYLNPEDKVCLEKISAITGEGHNSRRVYLFEEDGRFSSKSASYLHRTIDNFQTSEIELLFAEGNSTYDSIVKEQVKQIVLTFKENILSINKIKF